ncbi:MAG: hypothetical protein AB3X44_07645 [Leptothrix sp. (in: b-proteobacteria)]
MNQAQQQLQSIHAMLNSGHRSVQLERHSLLLLGGVGGLIVALTEYLITADRFPELSQRALALLLWLGATLGGLSVVEHRLTRRARQRRNETLPFAQAQITRAWWMLLGMGVLGSCAMFFYGGGPMVYALWIVLLGLGIYLFGLFSQALIEWIGLATLLLGVAALAAGLPYQATHWLAASCFAIGMPLAGWLNRRHGAAGLPGRTLALLLWLTLVAVPPLALAQVSFTSTPETPPLALGSGQLTSGAQVLRLAPGTPVALHLDLDSPLLSAAAPASLTLQLNVPLEVALRDGAPDGRYRFGNGAWHTIHDGALNLRIDRLAPQLENGQPVVRAHAWFNAPVLQGDAR